MTSRDCHPTAEEEAEPVVGDHLCPKPYVVATRCITMALLSSWLAET